MRAASDPSPGMRCALVLSAAVALVGSCRRGPRAPAAGEVHVRLVSGNGRPLAGARVAVARESATGPTEAGDARADGHGRVVVGGLAPGRYLLRTEAPGYATVNLPFE